MENEHMNFNTPWPVSMQPKSQTFLKRFARPIDLLPNGALHCFGYAIRQFDMLLPFLELKTYHLELRSTDFKSNVQ